MTIPKKSREEILAEMNAEAHLARDEYRKTRANSDAATFDSIEGLIAEWWKKWFATAGHKRLAYILMGKKLPGE